MSDYNNLFTSGSETSAPSTKEKLVLRGLLLRDRFATRDRKIDLAEDYYYRTGVFRRPDTDIYDVRVNDGQSAADLIADLVSGQGVGVIVPAHSEAVKAKKEANDVERWLNAWLKVVERDEDMRAVHEAALDIILRGAVVIRTLMLPDRIPDEKGKELSSFPLVFELRDYRYVYPVYKRTRVVEVFEAYDATVGDLRIDWSEFDPPEEWKDDETVTVWEWWSEDKKAFWVSGRGYKSGKDEKNVVWLMSPTSHGYGALPYTVRAMRPQTKSRMRPDRMAPSLMESWMGTLQAMNMLESAKFTATLAYINSAWAVTTNNRQDFELDLSHGAVNYLYEGETIEPIVKRDMPVDLQEISNEWAGKFQRASVPVALYGESIGPNMAGYAIALLNESGRRVLIPVVKALEAAFADTFSIALTVLEELLGPTLEAKGLEAKLYVTKEARDKSYLQSGVTLDWKKISSKYMVQVKLGDPMPQDKERNINMAVALRQPNQSGMPLMSDESIRVDILNVGDNQLEVTRILREQIMAEASQLIAQEQAVESGALAPEDVDGVTPEMGAEPPPEMGGGMPPEMPGGMPGGPPPEMGGGMPGGPPPEMGGGMPGGMPGGGGDVISVLVKMVSELKQRVDQIEGGANEFQPSEPPGIPAGLGPGLGSPPELGAAPGPELAAPGGPGAPPPELGAALGAALGGGPGLGPEVEGEAG